MQVEKDQVDEEIEVNCGNNETLRKINFASISSAHSVGQPTPLPIARPFSAATWIEIDYYQDKLFPQQKWIETKDVLSSLVNDPIEKQGPPPFMDHLKDIITYLHIYHT